MKFKNIAFLFSFQLVFSVVFSQTKAPANWFNLDHKKDKIYGVGAERSYKDLIKDRKGKPVVVAVIDGGTDTKHEDLKDVIWVNPNETPNNGIDDDKNGYIDDINGWNFIGGKNGKNVEQDNLEVTRVYAKLKSKYDKADTNKLSESAKLEYYNYQSAKDVFYKGKQESDLYSNLYASLEKGLENLRKNIDTKPIVFDQIVQYKPQNSGEKMAKQFVLGFVGKKTSVNDSVPFCTYILEINSGKEHFEKQANYSYNTELDTRKIVGDNYFDASEKYYGNNNVIGPNAGHGTHVAGIIAAVRNNNIGINGVANNVKIMVVRVVPDGDERDKDVANGIMYAVNNGATIINMSFGKAFSFNKKIVDDAVKFAISKDVLIVHAAGNDSKNNDTVDNFPTPYFNDNNERASGWIEVGASSWEKGKQLAATFSNFGVKTVDVFAPGVAIYSTTPDSKYAEYDGTSMAAPVTAGVAALIRSYYPQLSAAQVRDIIMKSSSKICRKVYVPGQTKTKTKLKNICASGGIVNAYEAIKLAASFR